MAVAAGGAVEELCDEITCSICLEYFKEPVTIDCGHNFCRDCLTQYWSKSHTDPSCPQCRETIPQKNFRPNRQLANVVALVKKLGDKKRAEGNWGACEKHQELLKLFCKADEALICFVCDKSKEHRDHTVIPAEEAVEEYKVKIQAQLQTLEKEREHLVDQKQAEEQRSQERLAQVGVLKQKFRTAFEQMETFLEERKAFWLAQLGHLEKEIEKGQKENIAKLSEEISSLTTLISEMEGKCQQTANELLQDIRSTLTRYQKEQVRQLKLSPHLEERLRSYSEKHSVLKETVGKCQESLKQVLSQVNVTVHPHIAHPSFVFPEELKSVRFGTRSWVLRNNP